MNDFVIQGVTILGSAPESLAYDYVTFALGGLFMTLAAVFLIVCLAEKDINLFRIALLSIVFFFSGLSCLIMKDKIKAGPDTIYTVSIDDTARYNEIKNAFATIRERNDGLYEITLKNIE